MPGNTPNTSRDSFVASKFYDKLALQQGVPIPDSDWNEMNDVLRMSFITALESVMGGSCRIGTESFQLKNASSTTNNFALDDGWALVDGVPVPTTTDDTPAEFDYDSEDNYLVAGTVTAINGGSGIITDTEQLFQSYHDLLATSDHGACRVKMLSGAESGNYFAITAYTATTLTLSGGIGSIAVNDTFKVVLPSLTTPSGARTDSVYLMVWWEDIASEEDSNIEHPGLGVETCHRSQRRWCVRVNEDTTTVPSTANLQAFTPRYLKLAEMARTATATIDFGVTVTLADFNIGDPLLSLAGSSKRNMYVLSDSTAGELADYAGATALQDAITDLTSDAVLYLRTGTYTLPTGADYTISGDSITIIGESRDATIVQVDPGYDFILSGDNIRLDNLTIEISTATGSSALNVASTAENITLKRLLLQDMSFNLNGTNTFIEDCECGGYDKAIVVNNTSTRINVFGLKCNHSSSPSGELIKIVEAKHSTFINVATPSTGVAAQVGVILGTGDSVECTFIGWEIYTGAEDAFQINGESDNCTFKNCKFSCTTGISFARTGGSPGRVSFESCEFYSNETLVDSDPSAGATQTMQLIFRDCIFENIGSDWYNAIAFRLENDRADGPVVMDNCSIVDRYSKGVVATSDPGEAVVGYTGDFVPFELKGIDARNLRISRSGMTHMVMDEEMIALTDCFVDLFRIDFGTGTLTPFVFDSSVDLSGIIAIYSDCTVKDMHVGQKFTGEWSKPLVFVLGTDLVSTCRHSVVDGLFIDASNSSDWYNPSVTDDPLVLQLAGAAIVRRFSWPETNLTGDVATTERSFALIAIEGSNNRFENAQIYVDSRTVASGGNTYVKHIIFFDGTASNTSQSVINNNRIYARPRGSGDDLEDLIYVVGQSHEIMHNYIAYDDDYTDYFIYTGSAYFTKVIGNHLILTGVTGSATDYFIYISSNPTTAIVAHNSLHSGASGAGAPEIQPNTVLGYADNIRLEHSVSPDVP